MGREYTDDQIDWDNWSYDDEGDSSVGKEKIIKVVDCNLNELQNGDSVMAIKDLKVKGAKDIKRGDKFKNIRLTDDVELIESGKMVLKTEFFKKV